MTTGGAGSKKMWRKAAILVSCVALTSALPVARVSESAPAVTDDLGELLRARPLTIVLSTDLLA